MAEAAKITGRDITFVVQGPVNTDYTLNCLTSIRTLFPAAELILSTYADQDLTNLTYDKLVLNDDPGVFQYTNKPDAKDNNVNRQLATTLAGLKAASKPYAFKIRTDFILNADCFLSFYDKFPYSEPQYQVFEHKLLACAYFSRNPRQKRSGFPHHPSDIAFFGLTADLLKLFDIPLMPTTEVDYYERNGYLHNRYRPEQYLWLNCLRKNSKTVMCEHLYHCNANIREATERYFVSNFVFLEWQQFGLTPPSKFASFVTNDYSTCFTHVEWLGLYQHYLNNGYSLPNGDPARKLIIRKKRQTNICDFVAKLMVLPLAGRSRRQFRRKLRQAIVDGLVTKILP